MARKKLDIEEWRVERLARHGMSNREIADFFACDESTIRGRFSAELTKGRANRKNLLRRCQWKAALNGNIAMLIWLGKQDLGQADKTESKVSGQDSTLNINLDLTRLGDDELGSLRTIAAKLAADAPARD